jgi:hypothetical protein
MAAFRLNSSQFVSLRLTRLKIGVCREIDEMQFRPWWRERLATNSPPLRQQTAFFRKVTMPIKLLALHEVGVGVFVQRMFRAEHHPPVSLCADGTPGGSEPLGLCYETASLTVVS